MQEKIKYSDIMGQGFKERQEEDKVYFAEFGYPYAIITLKLAKGIYLDWAKETQLCEMIKIKKMKVVARMPIKDVFHLKEIVSFFKAKENQSI